MTATVTLNLKNPYTTILNVGLECFYVKYAKGMIKLFLFLSSNYMKEPVLKAANYYFTRMSKNVLQAERKKYHITRPHAWCILQN